MAQNNEIKALNRQRGNIKSQLTNFAKYVDEVEPLDTLTNVELIRLDERLNKIDALIIDFNQVNNQIIDSVEDNLVEAQYQERNNFEDAYFSAISRAKAILAKYQPNINASASVSEQGSVVNSHTSSPRISENRHTKLPEIKLINFSGKYSEWVPFYDTFKSLIHNNDSLTPIQKFHYLRSCLQKEALQVIQNLEISSTNYESAWSLLERRYKNKQLMIHSHIKGIVEHPKLTKENFSALRDLLDSFQNHLRSLQALQQPVDTWDSILIYLITDKFDYVTKKEWESLAVKDDNLPSLDTLIEFLEQRCHLLEKIDKQTTERSSSVIQGHHGKSKNVIQTKVSYVSTEIKSKCPLCKESHGIFACKTFLGLSVNNRRIELKKHKLCLNCLQHGHLASNCGSSGRCRVCKGLHNTLIHATLQPETKGSQSLHDSHENLSTSKDEPKHETLSHQSLCYNIQQILPTAVVNILDKQGKAHACVALLDSGSMSNFIREDLCRRLRLDVSEVSIPVSGLNRSKSKVTGKTTATIISRFSDYQATLSFLSLPQITGVIPVQPLDTSKLLIPENCQLANENFNTPSSIDILLGVDIFWEVVRTQSELKHPYLHDTLFGVVVSGPLQQSRSKHTKVSCHFSQSEISTQISRFWEVESCPQDIEQQSDEERLCEKHFRETTRRADDGRFIVSLPLSGSLDSLGDSKEQAEKRFLNLEKRLLSNPSFRAAYSDFMSEYEQLGHMSKIDESLDDSFYSFYLPHHGVFKQNSLTTKLRVVFDGSAPSTTGISINSLHMVGPTIQRDLFSILVSFRKHKYVLSADCTKMYRSVLVEPCQRSLQRILWRSDPSEPLNTYNLNTITYGLSSSSFMAIRCLFQLADDFQNEYPEISHVIRNDMYVDDLLTGSDDIEGASVICEKISEIFRSGGFQLRKWSSNAPEVLQTIKDPDISCNILEFDVGESTKTLGMLWSSITDDFLFKISVDCPSDTITKRKVLSVISSIFDPLGLLSPCTITAKIFMQKLWTLEIAWDDPLPDELYSQWSRYIRNLPHINEIKIPRYVCFSQSELLEFHAFCDASQSAYGVCIYIRSLNSDGKIMVRLVCSKTRVAPLKTLTIPRLELLGAQILCKLANKVIEALGLSFQRRYFWSDSTIVLGWIKTKPHILKTFVSNRVSEIQSNTKSDEWRYVPTSQNPADLLTRGVSPQELQSSILWWNGPSFLEESEHAWPSLPQVTVDLPEVKPTHIHNYHSSTTMKTIDFERFSSLSKLERVMAYVIRFIRNSKQASDKRDYSILSTHEIQAAHFALIKLVQSSEFEEELRALSSGKMINKKSKIISLHPFIDQTGILRVGGRLQNSSFSFSKKHPIILPGSHRFTKLLIQREHSRLLHAGPSHLLSSIRETYWPLHARNLIKGIVRNCITCFRCKPKNSSFLMGNLPSDRVSPAPPFQVTGVDYAGPFLIKDRKGRGAKLSKCYVCIFVCFCTRAIHIELVSDLTTEAFILALRRFSGRRCMPSKIYSDNGTNFVGAKSRLKELWSFLAENTNEIQTACLKENINWQFIPSYSPHMGGIWEAGVKSVKSHLMRVIGNHSLTFEGLYSVLVQIEAVLNSRPLIPLSSDPSDFTALTPAHFLVGRTLTSVPNPDVTHIPTGRLSYYQQLQHMVQHFWKRWSTEYISNLQQRTKWKHGGSDIKKGTLVLLKDENQPPLKWSLGRIVDLHPGTDNVIRVVSVRTVKGIVRRSLAKVCPLPVDCSE